MIDQKDIETIRVNDNSIRHWFQGLECACDDSVGYRCDKHAVFKQLAENDVALSRIEAEARNCGEIADAQKDTQSDVIMQREKLLQPNKLKWINYALMVRVPQIRHDLNYVYGLTTSIQDGECAKSALIAAILSSIEAELTAKENLTVQDARELAQDVAKSVSDSMHTPIVLDIYGDAINLIEAHDAAIRADERKKCADRYCDFCEDHESCAFHHDPENCFPCGERNVILEATK